jgi:hypothetical protein
MPATANGLSALGESSRAMRALALRKTATAARGIVTAEQLMAPEYGVVLPHLDGLPLEHRFVDDDSEVIKLAEILVNSNIAATED